LQQRGPAFGFTPGAARLLSVLAAQAFDLVNYTHV
jgi:hypothetical protein